MRTRRFIWLWALAGLWLGAAAQAQELVVSQTSFGPDAWVQRGEPLEWTLSRAVAPNDGRVAVIVGHVDVSDLIQIDGQRLVYDPAFRPLEAGSYEITIFLVDADENWVEIDRRPVQVLTRAGFEIAEFDPRLDVSFESQVTERHSEDFGDPERHKYLKGTGQAGWTSHHAGYGFDLTTNANIFAASFQDEALRFGTEDTHARRVDLSDYLAQLSFGPATVQAGHFAYGNHRHLIDNFSTRGVGVTVQPHPRIAISGASMNGTAIVGYNNITGLRDSENQVHAATLSLQLLDNEFASGVLEGSWMSGSVANLSNFNSGQIRDAEKSWGIGLRYFGEFLWGRMRTDLSWAHSRFDNAKDPDLAILGIDPESETTWESARYGEAAIDILKDFHLFGDRYATFTVYGSHETIDPEYKSLGVFTNADTTTNTIGVITDVAGIFLQAQKTFVEDNLLDLTEVLKTRTRDVLIVAQAPLPFIIGGYEEPIYWLPTLGFTYNRVHQFGANVPDPIRSGFNDPLSQIPDQIDKRWDGSATWNLDWMSLTYRYSDATQNNRQRAQRANDFKTRTHDINVSVTPIDTLFLNVGASRTIQRSRGIDLKRRTLSTSASFDWEFVPGWTLSATGFRTREGDSENATKVVSTTLEGQLAWQFSVPVTRGYSIPGRLFGRWTRQSNRFTDNVFGVNTRVNQWTFLVGGSFSLF